MNEAKKVVECSKGQYCKKDHHGWDCVLSDPIGDLLRSMMDPLPNPLLENTRLSLVKKWMKDED